MFSPSNGDKRTTVEVRKSTVLCLSLQIFGVVMQQWCDNQEEFHGDGCIKICVTALCEVAKFAVTSLSIGTEQQLQIAMIPLRMCVASEPCPLCVCVCVCLSICLSVSVSVSASVSVSVCRHLMFACAHLLFSLEFE